MLIVSLGLSNVSRSVPPARKAVLSELQTPGDAVVQVPAERTPKYFT